MSKVSASAADSGAALRKLLVQGVFLFTGVFSTCVAQFVFYQGAGDQKAMLLPLCNYLGMMLVGLLPAMGAATTAAAKKAAEKEEEEEIQQQDGLVALEKPQEVAQVSRSPEDDVEPELTPTQTDSLTPTKRRSIDLETADMELTRRTTVAEEDNQKEDQEQLQELLLDDDADTSDDEKKPALGFRVTPSSVSFSLSTVQLCVIVSVVLDFAGCIFSNVGLSMAGSGLYQVVYSSVICWSALMSRFILKKIVSKEEWFGIALVTFGLAFSALGESGSGRDNTVVLMGCFNTLVGAAFYGGNYVTGEYTLKLAERPHPKELCLKIGAACVAIIAVYQSIFVLPEWDALVTKPIAEANGNTTYIVSARGVHAVAAGPRAHVLRDAGLERRRHHWNHAESARCVRVRDQLDAVLQPAGVAVLRHQARRRHAHRREWRHVLLLGKEPAGQGECVSPTVVAAPTEERPQDQDGGR